MASSSSLVLRSLLKGAVARLALGRAHSLSGLTPQAKALVVAAAAHDEPDRGVLFVVPTEAAIDSAVADVRFFLGATEGIGDVALSGLVLPFPSLQADPYRALTPHMRVSSARARALLAMATGAARVVVASAPALLQRLTAPSMLVARSLGVRTGAEIDPQALSTLLAEAGYDRQDPVDDHGETACAAASSTSTRPTSSGRSGSSSSATWSNRSGASIPGRSVRSRPSISSWSCRSASRSRGRR